MKKKEILITIMAFLLGMGIMYVYTRNELAANKTITRRIIDNCIDSLNSSDKIINACGSAYSEVASCFSNLYVCNLEESKKRLEIFNIRREQGEKEIQNATKNTDKIINDVKNSRN